jgi:hypothetical protein
MAIWDLIEIPPRMDAIPNERIIVAISKREKKEKMILTNRRRAPIK